MQALTTAPRPSPQARGAMRDALSAAVAKEAARAAAVADGVATYPGHVYESLEIMDEERVNIDAIAALVFHLDAHRPPGAILVFMPGDDPADGPVIAFRVASVCMLIAF